MQASCLSPAATALLSRIDGSLGLDGGGTRREEGPAMHASNVVFGLAGALIVSVGCSSSGQAPERQACERGTEACGCRADAVCDPGLTCVSAGADGDRCDPADGA